MGVQLTKGTYFFGEGLHTLFYSPKSNLTLGIGTGVVYGLSSNICIIHGGYRLIEIFLQIRCRGSIQIFHLITDAPHYF